MKLNVYEGKLQEGCLIINNTNKDNNIFNNCLHLHDFGSEYLTTASSHLIIRGSRFNFKHA